MKEREMLLSHWKNHNSSAFFILEELPQVFLKGTERKTHHLTCPIYLCNQDHIYPSKHAL